MATVINSLVNTEISLKKSEVAQYLKHHPAIVNGRVPSIVVSHVSKRRTFVGFQFHPPLYDGVVTFDGLPDGAVLAQLIDGQWK